MARAGVRSDFEPPTTESWRRIGVFDYKPTFVLKNIGQDSNVFYDPDTGDPRSDFTATASPALDGLVGFGNRGFLTMHAQTDYVWYETYSNATHLDYQYGLRGNLNFRALRFFAAGGYDRVDERPSNELDARAQRTSHIQRGGAGYEVSPKTAVDLIFAKEKINYQDSDFVTYVSCRTPEGVIDPKCRAYQMGD